MKITPSWGAIIGLAMFVGVVVWAWVYQWIQEIS